jgi:hypothetical protein
MDLALHLGKTVGQVEREMSGVELGLWYLYANDRMLPWRRMEMHLAQIAMHVSGLAGAADKTLSDFLFDPPERGIEEDAKAFFGFSPRNVRKDH